MISLMYINFYQAGKINEKNDLKYIDTQLKMQNISCICAFFTVHMSLKRVSVIGVIIQIEIKNTVGITIQIGAYIPIKKYRFALYTK